MHEQALGDMHARSEQIRRDAEHCSSVTHHGFATLLRRSLCCFLSASKVCIWNIGKKKRLY